MSNLYLGSEHAKTYSKYRPTYPKDVFETIVGYVSKKSSSFDLALDVACGNGQGTFPLPKFYNKVIGIDASEAQISEAKVKNINCDVTFKVGKAEDLGFLEDASVDLVTCAQALHWFDMTSFYEEVKRVLKPDGVLACYGYGIHCLESKEVEKCLEKVNIFGHKNGRNVTNSYADLPFPMTDIERFDNLKMEKIMKLSEFIGYMSSLTSFQIEKKENPNSTTLQDLQNSLLSAIRKETGTTSDDPEMAISWPCFILLGRR